MGWQNRKDVILELGYGKNYSPGHQAAISSSVSGTVFMLESLSHYIRRKIKCRKMIFHGFFPPNQFNGAIRP